MNFSSLLGLILAGSVFIAALKATSDDIKFFLDMHGILIVVGGTTAAACISFPIKDLLMLLKVFFLRVLGSNKANYSQVINQILELNKRSTQGLSAMNELVPTLKHPFLKEAVSLLTAGVLTEHELRATLEQRLKTTESHYMKDANMFKTIAKFPPAFGLLATTLGMIGVLQKIGQPDSQKLIGPAMSVGLIGTLYGIALTNLVLLPIAESLVEKTVEEIALRRIIVEGIILLKSQVNPVSLREQLNSYVLPKHRAIRKA